MFLPLVIFVEVVLTAARPINDNVTSLLSAAVDRVRFVDCGEDGNSTAIAIDMLDFGPMPIKIPGPLPVKIRANILRPVPNNVDVKIVLRKRKADAMDEYSEERNKDNWVKLPCFLGFGSCKFYDIPTCLITEHVLGCPLLQRYYSVERQIILMEPGAGFRRLMEGDYRITLKIRHPVTMEILSCLRAQFSLAAQ